MTRPPCCGLPAAGTPCCRRTRRACQGPRRAPHRLRMTPAVRSCSYFGTVRRRLEILISGAGIAGPTVAYWLVRRGHRPVLVERTPDLCVGGHAVDIRGTALEVVEGMGLDTAVRRPYADPQPLGGASAELRQRAFSLRRGQAHAAQRGRPRGPPRRRRRT